MYIRRPYPNELYHWGIKGQRWGIRRFQNPDGSLTPAGRKRYANLNVAAPSDATNAVKSTMSAMLKNPSSEMKRQADAYNSLSRDEQLDLLRQDPATVRKHYANIEKARKAAYAAESINSLKKIGFEDDGTYGNTTFMKRIVKTDIGPVKLKVNVDHDGSNPPNIDVVKDFIIGKQKMKEIDSKARKVCEESANRMYGMSVGKLMSIDVMSDGNCLINYEGNPTKPDSGVGSYGIFYTEFNPRTKKVGTYASYDD